MSQINLDTSPYFDDFDEEKEFYKVLFKPGFPVQARELTTLQSILQNQISKFGEHFFKEGSMVIPGAITYNGNYTCVLVNPQQGGIDVSLYLDKLIGTKIVGQISGVRAKVVNILLPPDEVATNPTIYISYEDSGSDEEQATFLTNEPLINESPIVYGNTTISAGSIFATTLVQDAVTTGSAAQIADGIYFIRSTFVKVSESVVILEPYNNNPTFRVGLQISQSIVTAGQDETLYDNAKGFNNFSAPGADRLKITAALTKKPIDDTNDTNFIELMRVTDGELKKLEESTNYNYLKDYIAKRTYDESGDYVVKGMGVTIDESLNNGLGNGGSYTKDQLTEEGAVPTSDLACVKIQAGTAYVRGYDVKTPGTTNLDAPKPRTTANIASAAIPFEMGTQYIVNNVTGTPAVGLNYDDNIVQLFNGRVSGGVSSGDLIGEGRVYAFELHDGRYENASTTFDLFLFDTQIFTKFTANVDPTSLLIAGYRVKGLSSNSTAYVRSVNGNQVTLTQVDGEFQLNETLSINNSTSNTVTIAALETYKADQVRSISQSSSNINPGLQANFTADNLLYPSTAANFFADDTYTITSGGLCVCGGRTFDSYKVGDIFAYQKSGSELITFNRVASIAGDDLGMVLEAVADVPGLVDGTLPSGTIDVQGRKMISQVFNQDRSFLYSVLEERNIAKLDLSNSSLPYTKQVTGLSIDANGQMTINSASLDIPNSNFTAYDQNRYSICLSNGQQETIDSTAVAVSPNVIVFNNLTPNQTNVTANVTAVKNSIRSKTKVVVRSQELVVDRISSGIGTETLSLQYSPYYGLRVDDQEVSLNVPDVRNVVAVYEALDGNTPTLDVLQFVAGLALDTNLVKGELVRGEISGAIAQVITVPDQANVRIVYLSQNKFEVGELLVFQESGLQNVLQGVVEGNYQDITDSYTLDNGYREQFYDYSRIVRSDNGVAPVRKLLIIFDKLVVPNDDKGDFYTANTYDDVTFEYRMPNLGPKKDIRASDTLDFRPRVRDFDPAVTNDSPFNYIQRDFGSVGNTALQVIAPNENMTIGYDYYLGRQDRVIVTKEGDFQLVQGAPNRNPTLPDQAETAMELARIEYPPYVFDMNDVKVIQIDNKRYTMKDIGRLEDRIENLEEITSLSLLERQAQSTEIIDAQGNNRFKTGFFADDFTSLNFVDLGDPDYKADVIAEFGTLACLQEFNTLPVRLLLKDGLDSQTINLDSDLPLVDANTTKTGDLVTLDYDEAQWITQPLCSRIENVNPFNVILYNGNVAIAPRSDDFVVTRNLGTTRINVYGTTTGDFSKTFVEGIEVAQFMRERNVAFSADGLRPHTRFYPFWDGQAGADVIPKLIEINMRSGAFIVGETVRGYNGSTQIFAARVAEQNHKTGPFNAPQRIYTQNPYNRTEVIPSAYSGSSTVLNIDIFSLADQSDDRYYGLIANGVRLEGSSSRAVADVTDVKLVADTFAELQGCIYFRDPYASPPPAFRLRTGIRTFRLTSSPTNEKPVLGSTLVSYCETTFESSGTVQNRRTEVIGVQDLPPPPPPIIIDKTVTNNFTRVIDRTRTRIIDRTVTVRNNFIERRVIDRTRTIVNNRTRIERRIVRRPQRRQRRPRRRYDDPLAQTFRVDETGAFLTSVDIFMASKSLTDNLAVEIRTTELGTPTVQLVQSYARVVLGPDEVNVSSDGSVPTNVVFPSPIYLEPDVTYALVLLAPTTDDYNAWIARMGEGAIEAGASGLADGVSTSVQDDQAEQETNDQSITEDQATGEVDQDALAAAGGQVIISQQYLNGSLFKSQNGSIWTPSQFEDLKFTLYKAEFTDQEGTVFLTNPPLSNSTPLRNNGILTLPRKVRCRIAPTSFPFQPGDSITSVGSGFTMTAKVPADIEALGGPITTLTITDGGAGFIDGSYSAVEAYPLGVSGVLGRNGSLGESATVNVTVASGIITSVTVVDGGNGYKVGDTIGIKTSDVANAGGDAVITIDAIGQTDTLYLTNVEGERYVSTDDIKKVAENGTLIDTGVSVDPAGSTVVDPMYDGSVFVVDCPNHSLHADNQNLSISNCLPDQPASVLSEQIDITSTSLTVLDPSSFNEFEGITTSVGYAYLGGEIIEYSNLGNGQLGISSRGVDGTAVLIHDQGTRVYKYEVSGVSLRRINSAHKTPIDSTLGETRQFNTLPLQIDRSGRNSGPDMLCFTSQSEVGGANMGFAQNFQFNRILPSMGLFTPGETTSASGTIRTVTGTSCDGNEASFIDTGYVPATIDNFTRFDTPRLVANRLNEVEYLADIPAAASLTYAVSMKSTDPNLSPVLDISQTSMILVRNCINRPVKNFADDARVNRIIGDPHASIYISSRININNPSTSLKVFLTAYRDESCDFRVLYRLFGASSQGSTDPSWELFPGYTNMLDTDGDGYGDTVIDLSKNNGLPNAQVRPSAVNEFLEYEYEQGDLPEFQAFQLKIVMAGTNEARAPFFRDVRAIALA